MAPPTDSDHECGWKAYAQDLEQRVSALEKAFQRKSERRKKSKLPPAAPKKPPTREETRQTRDAIAALRDAKVEPIPAAPGACKCGDCGSTELRQLGEGKPSTVFEYIPPRFRKHIYLRQTLACQCGKVITTEAPARVGLKTRYAPSFVAHLCTSKLADSIPQHRLEKEYKRLEIPIPRSTMNALLHRAADELEPLHAAACALVRRLLKSALWSQGEPTPHRSDVVQGHDESGDNSALSSPGVLGL